MELIEIQGHRLEYARVKPVERSVADGNNGNGNNNDVPPIVMLHEGLGSLSLWRNFPQQVAEATGAEVIVYSRYGYGRSDSLEPGRNRREVRYMHDEALHSLPEFLDKLGIEKPFLFGHSDGGSIALIQAGCRGASKRPLSGIAVMAPHLFVEQVAIDGILRTRALYETTGLRERLARHHADVDGVFWGWNDIWLSPAFRAWNIEAYVPHIDCPILAIQGEGDEYGTLEQIERIQRLARHAPEVELLALPDCGHSPHKDQPAAVLAAVAAFVGAPE